MNSHKAYTVSVVIPVYRGELTLPALLEEICPLTKLQTTRYGHDFLVSEVLLVHDCGPDSSDKIIEGLCAEYSFVKPIWLTRNFGQHAATLAGLSSAAGHWIVTIDEDGQQDPADIPEMLDCALRNAHQVVYAHPTNSPPHGWLRNLSSRAAKFVVGRFLGCRNAVHFNSFRLIDGEIARILAAYCGTGIYMDIALLWMVERVGYCPLRLRNEMNRPSGYSYGTLFAHFWRMVLATGVRPLRLITFMGIFSVFVALGISIYAIAQKMIGGVAIQGWASIVIIVAFFSGCILISLGIIAEYLALTMSIAMGKPLYVVGTKSHRKIASRE